MTMHRIVSVCVESKKKMNCMVGPSSHQPLCSVNKQKHEASSQNVVLDGCYRATSCTRPQTHMLMVGDLHCRDLQWGSLEMNKAPAHHRYQSIQASESTSQRVCCWSTMPNSTTESWRSPIADLYTHDHHK